MGAALEGHQPALDPKRYGRSLEKLHEMPLDGPAHAIDRPGRELLPWQLQEAEAALPSGAEPVGTFSCSGHGGDRQARGSHR
jgi:hypothetical protein